MNGISEWEIAIRLFLSAFLASLIGLERESHGRPAGLRTHILVSLGSCLIMLISVYGFSTSLTRDPARLAAQVVSGIGFLGAGTILREGVSVKGLTTAASLWVVAGIGLAMGGGFYIAGTLVTFFSVLILLFLEPIERKFFSFRTYHLHIILKNTCESEALRKAFNFSGWKIKHLEIDSHDDRNETTLEIIIEAKDLKKDEVLIELMKIEGIKKITWK